MTNVLTAGCVDLLGEYLAGSVKVTEYLAYRIGNDM